MSIKIMSEVWEHSKAKGSELLLLLAIADHADSTSRQAFPSVTRLARLIRMSKRQTQRLLQRLEHDGHITIKLGAGPRGTHLYRVSSCHLHTCARDISDTKGGDIAVSPEPTSSEPRNISEIEKTALRWLSPESSLFRDHFARNGHPM